MLTAVSTEQGKAQYSLPSEAGPNKEVVCSFQISIFEDFSKW